MAVRGPDKVGRTAGGTSQVCHVQNRPACTAEGKQSPCPTLAEKEWKANSQDTITNLNLDNELGILKDF
jgi:hypothetical protein